MGGSRVADAAVAVAAALAALLLAGALGLAAVIAPATARAADTAPDSSDVARAAGLPDSSAAPRDTTLRKVKPFFVMARSAVVPGWGQVYNRQPLKAVVVVAGEAFLVHKIFQELGRQNDAIDRAATAEDSAGIAQALTDEEIHKNKKIDWIWWTAAAHLLQMADAYVDAHFINFDAEFGPDDDRVGTRRRAAPRLSLALQVKF